MITFDLLNKLIAELAGDTLEITPECKLSDFGFDSLDMLQLYQEIERITKKPITIAKLNNNMSLSELLELINIQ